MSLPKATNDTFGEALGSVVGEATASRVLVRTREPLKVGEYVIIEPLKGGNDILGWVEESIAKNDLIEDIINLESTELAETLVKQWELTMVHTKYFATVKLLSEVDPLVKEGRHEPPRTAPDPGSRVYKADRRVLEKIFSKADDPRYVRLGVLSAHPDVPFYVDVNSIISRHLAIVAVTGAGKSNTVTVLANRIVKEKRGCVLIFDMHGEYHGAIEDNYLKVIHPVLDPTKLDADAMAKLMGLKDAPKQELYLRNILKVWKVIERSTFVRKKEFYNIVQNMIIELMKGGMLPILNDAKLKMIVDLLREEGKFNKQRPLRSVIEVLEKSQRNSPRCKKSDCSDLFDTLKPTSSDVNSSIPNLLIKFQDMISRYSNILKFNAPDIVDEIEPGKLNVMDLHTLDEDMADVVVSIAMKKILNARKNSVHETKEKISDMKENSLHENEKSKFPVPILLVLEEAHILAPANRRTLTKYWVSRITREGRKFGVGLCMVSQRPKGLDQDALSQANNMIVMKLIEPGDQRHVQASSEALSEELVKQLPSLATGEALVLGPLAPLPAIVRVDKAERKGIGHDLDVVKEWMKTHNEEAKRSSGEDGTWEE